MASRIQLMQLKKDMVVRIQLRSSYFLIDAMYTGRMKDSDFAGAHAEWWRCFKPLARINSGCRGRCDEFGELILRECRHGKDWIVWDDSFYKSKDAWSVHWDEEEKEDGEGQVPLGE